MALRVHLVDLCVSKEDQVILWTASRPEFLSSPGPWEWQGRGWGRGVGVLIHYVKGGGEICSVECDSYARHKRVYRKCKDLSGVQSGDLLDE